MNVKTYEFNINNEEDLKKLDDKFSEVTKKIIKDIVDMMGKKMSKNMEKRIDLYDVASTLYAHLHYETDMLPSIAQIMSDEEIEKLTELIRNVNDFINPFAMKIRSKDSNKEKQTSKKEAPETENGEDK